MGTLWLGPVPEQILGDHGKAHRLQPVKLQKFALKRQKIMVCRESELG
jgi:hypothetical protein